MAIDFSLLIKVNHLHMFKFRKVNFLKDISYIITFLTSVLFVSGQTNSFNQNALQNIKNRKLSDIICDNTNIKELPSNVFINNNDPSNSIKRCDTNDVNHLEFSKINLILVKENGASNLV